MSHGKMMCCGSSEYLKNKYGEGYNLVVVKNGREDNVALEDFILNSIPGSQKLQEVSTEATFLLPKTAVDTFKDFFPKFDDNLANLDCSSYGLSMATLEEVFLRVEKQGQKDHKIDQKADKNSDSVTKIEEEVPFIMDEEIENYSISKTQLTNPFLIFLINIYALLIK